MSLQGPTFDFNYEANSDQLTGSKQLAESLGLNNISNSTYGRDPNKRTFSSAMSKVIGFLESDKSFTGVTFTEAYPDNDTQCPRIVWKLKSRTAGVNGVNRKHAFWAEDEPLEDGRVLIKMIQPQQFEMVFEIFDTGSDDVDNLRDKLETWLYYHKFQLAVSGFELLVFSSELEPSIFEAGNSQKLYRRQLYYTGVINYIYQDIQDRLQSIRIWRTGQDVTLRTTELVRQSDTLEYDPFPVRGPVVIVAVHTLPATVSVDYLYNIDFVTLVDKTTYGTQFFIKWIPKGKLPTPGSKYYVTYYLPAVDVKESNQTLLTESSTDPSLLNLPPESSSFKVRRSGRRSAITPNVLGQAIDPSNPDRGRTIVFSEENTGLFIPGLTNNYLESLIKADTEVVSVLNPASIPGLNPGTALQPL